MFIIPTQDKKFSQPNTSDLEGNIWYSKNINFDEKGYIKLASRSASLYSEKDDSGLGFPYSIGRINASGGFNIITSNYEYLVSITPSAITLTSEIGANTPGSSTSARGKWWQNTWNVTTDTGLKYRDGVTGTWSTAGTVSLTSGQAHPIEVFKTRTTLCIGNGNVVKQYTTTYAASTDLTIPSDYQVTGLAFSNINKMGIATQLASSLSGQNTETQFYIWDGSTALPNSSIPTGTDAIIAIAAYLGTWVILTRQGKLKKYNGSSFEEIATLPFSFKKLDLAYSAVRSSVSGDIFTVDGDMIYINFPAILTAYGIKQHVYLQNMPGGILCYDPRVGIYHKYSPSFSRLYPLQTGSANISTTTGIITKTSGTLPATGNPILYSSDATNLIGGLTVGAIYYVIRVDSTRFKLATSKENAIAGTFITLTSTGAASSTFIALDLVDYGASLFSNANGTALVGGNNLIYDHFIYGGNIFDYNSSTSYRNIFITVPLFKNIGYIVTPKLESQMMQDNFHKLYIKHRPLTTGDKIVVKVKTDDVIGLPVSTPQRSSSCTWTSSTVFTTTADLSEVYTFLQTTGNECECEITSGAGAGQSSQITSVGYSAGTYTVTLVDSIEGAASGYVCNVIIDNWKKLDEITSSNTKNWYEIPLNISSKWQKFKIELHGVETTIEQVQIINDSHMKNK